MGSFLGLRVSQYGGDIASLFLALLFVALSWESLELAIEIGKMGSDLAYWKGGYEHLSNRLLGDPLMMIYGGMLSRAWRDLWMWFTGLSLIWIMVNAFSEKSMSVQEFLLDYFWG